ncbi:cyanate hydratase [Cryptococcus amylolentus CBS 6039]|uniref:Cyanate hydratase n=1 Tax=Cryptococcus amylolentus CBS 6039 TaxID=1295533 RepID=A0A1E3HFS0_9TREE|nr:cyanate hydratase [Cryptococcus amylolentus CBS 6039]ODN75198.1 cyanate hydratase [Cryptococcus amylolentus CBS 6039]
MFDLPYHCKAILAAKSETGKTFDDIAKSIGKPEVWTTALFYGQATTNEETANAILNALGGQGLFDQLSDHRTASGDEQIIYEKVLKGLSGKGEENYGVPGLIQRGATIDLPPKDPVLYRLYEALIVYGFSYKALIQEKVNSFLQSLSQHTQDVFALVRRWHHVCYRLPYLVGAQKGSQGRPRCHHIGRKGERS